MANLWGSTVRMVLWNTLFWGRISHPSRMYLSVDRKRIACKLDEDLIRIVRGRTFMTSSATHGSFRNPVTFVFVIPIESPLVQTLAVDLFIALKSLL